MSTQNRLLSVEEVPSLLGHRKNYKSVCLSPLIRIFSKVNTHKQKISWSTNCPEIPADVVHETIQNIAGWKIALKTFTGFSNHFYSGQSPRF
jgi:hypothetical protein